MAFAGFAVFGAFWGASIPAIRDQAGVTEGQLGAALLLIGAGALPAMLLSGRAVERWGLRATAALLALLGGAGLLVAAAARDLVTLALALALLGAVSGAADVAINTAAGSAQRASDRPVVTRAHAMFSTAVVGTSLLAGALRGLDAAVVMPFVVAPDAAAAVATTLACAAAPDASRRRTATRPARRSASALDPERRDAFDAATDRVGAAASGTARAPAVHRQSARSAVPLAPLPRPACAAFPARMAPALSPPDRGSFRACCTHVLDR